MNNFQISNGINTDFKVKVVLEKSIELSCFNNYSVF